MQYVTRRMLLTMIVWLSMMATTVGSVFLPSPYAAIVYYAGIHCPVFLAAWWLWKRKSIEEWGEISRSMTVLAVLWTGATPRDRFEVNMFQLGVIAMMDLVLALRRRDYLLARETESVSDEKALHGVASLSAAM